MKREPFYCLLCTGLCLIGAYFICLSNLVGSKIFLTNPESYDRPDDFQGFNNDTGTANGCYIVPNIVHFVRFGRKPFTFVDSVCVLAAYKNQKPEIIFFHTDQPYFRGLYWNIILSTPGLGDIVRLKFVRAPTRIFAHPLSFEWRRFHGGDIARLQILMEYGGIYLDNDSYIVKSLDEFRRFEMTVGWKINGNLSNQVIVAHRNARFLREWLLSYKDNYRAKSWFYNAGIRPTQAVLVKRPELVHRVSRRLAEYNGIASMLYLTRTDAWREHYAIHLLINHQYMLGKNFSSNATYPVRFSERNIDKYPVTFRDMVYDVFPFAKLNTTRSVSERKITVHNSTNKS
ncbi:Glycosyltransferase sugar-Hypothetical protein region containing DXD motif [Nesidiocoris tenuis]|uniref:Alpha-1,4-N-acetylglucosaminyltransferase n=1 Tax=Nesidiocoris tenuis TaxID=355587 RepID=A0ABN7AQ05_9HEMI|nr:Glycosyltransferase sugar-Hypothetical protein region containing DXD motif [Nesidiocoris tenuis]